MATQPQGLSAFNGLPLCRVADALYGYLARIYVVKKDPPSLPFLCLRGIGVGGDHSFIWTTKCRIEITTDTFNILRVRVFKRESKDFSKTLVKVSRPLSPEDREAFEHHVAVFFAAGGGNPEWWLDR